MKKVLLLVCCLALLSFAFAVQAVAQHWEKDKVNIVGTVTQVDTDHSLFTIKFDDNTSATVRVDEDTGFLVHSGETSPGQPCAFTDLRADDHVRVVSIWEKAQFFSAESVAIFRRQ